MSFDDLIEESEQFLHRKHLLPKDDASWRPHFGDRFENLLPTQDAWVVWKLRSEHESKSELRRQSAPARDQLVRVALGDFAWSLCALPDVETISVFRSDDVFNVSTIITNLNIEAERKIANAEAELLRGNPDLQLDFTVIPRHGRRRSDLVPPGSEVLYSKK